MHVPQPHASTPFPVPLPSLLLIESTDSLSAHRQEREVEAGPIAIQHRFTLIQVSARSVHPREKEMGRLIGRGVTDCRCKL
jgi:hypothetical protein